MSTHKIHLIWPPFLNSRYLSLAVPSLVGFLKHRGFQAVDVFDMNVAYWKTLSPHWSFYSLLRRAQGILKRKGGASSSVQRFLDGRIGKVLEDMEKQGLQYLPWSLDVILESFRSDLWFVERQRVRALMQPFLAREDLDFVGLSINFPDQLFFALMIAHELKEARGDSIRVVAGGAQITKNIGKLTGNKDVHRLIDYFITGDGEEPLLRLLTTYPDTEGLARIPNLTFKDPQRQDAYVSSGDRFTLAPDDFVVPDFQGFDLDVYQDPLPVLGAAGCPWGQCSFCSYAGAQDRRFLAGSPEKTSHIIREMQKRYGCSDFAFMDNALLPGYMKVLAEQFLRDHLEVSWTSNINLGKEYADLDFCRLLKKSGLRWVGFGLESVNRRLLGLMNKYHKNLEPEEIRKVLKVVRAAGIEIGVYVFFGFPTETREEARQTLDFLLLNMDLFDYIGMTPFFLEDLTLVFDEPGKYGITQIHTQDKARFVNKRLSYDFETKEGMTREETNTFCREAMILLQKAFKKKSLRPRVR